MSNTKKELDTLSSIEEVIAEVVLDEELILQQQASGEATAEILLPPQGSKAIKNEAIFILAAHNMSMNQIAHELDVSLPTIRKYLDTPDGAKRVAYHREKLFGGAGIRKKMEQLSNTAVQNLEAFLSDPITTEKTRYQATTYVLDQSVGKAKQTVEVQQSLLSDFMDKLANAREVTQLPALDVPKDSFDNFIDENIPSHKVGVRTNGKSK